MPTVKWNKSWDLNLKAFKKGQIRGKYYGDQWGVPDQNPSLKKVVTDHITPFVQTNMTALEIGSGGGRWTQYLLDFKKLYCVELNESMFEVLRERFPDLSNMEFVKTNGTDLPNVNQSSIDFVFSFGTLVHCDAPIIDGYLSSLYEVMKPGARAHLQFSDKRKPRAADNPDFADTTPEIIQETAERRGYRVEVMDDWTMDHSAIAQLVRS